MQMASYLKTSDLVHRFGHSKRVAGELPPVDGVDYVDGIDG
ncbi:MAG: hypothetical protein AB1797_10350 [bacterium]